MRKILITIFCFANSCLAQLPINQKFQVEYTNGQQEIIIINNTNQIRTFYIFFKTKNGCRNILLSELSDATLIKYNLTNEIDKRIYKKQKQIEKDKKIQEEQGRQQRLAEQKKILKTQKLAELIKTPEQEMLDKIQPKYCDAKVVSVLEDGILVSEYSIYREYPTIITGRPEQIVQDSMRFANEREREPILTGPMYIILGASKDIVDGDFYKGDIYYIGVTNYVSIGRAKRTVKFYATTKERVIQSLSGIQ